jgi:ribonuclease P protein component
VGASAVAMKRAQRLRKAAEFQRVRARRRSWTHPLLMLYAAENGTDCTRVGIVAGRWVGNAVARNRVKRRVREVIREQYAAIAPGYDLVWLARPGLATADHRALVAAVEHLLQRARLLRDGRISAN